MDESVSRSGAAPRASHGDNSVWTVAVMNRLHSDRSTYLRRRLALLLYAPKFIPVCGERHVGHE